jgi:hypothetical protein
VDPKGNLLEPLPAPRFGAAGFVYIIPAGASDSSGSLTLRLSASASSFVDTRLSRVKDIPTQEAPLIRIDSVVEGDVYFMSVDTQGFEYRAVTGASKLLRAGQVRLMMTEFTPQLLEPAPANVPKGQWPPLTGAPAKKLLELITEEYGLLCFSTNGGGIMDKEHFTQGHPEEKDAFLEHITKVRLPFPSVSRLDNVTYMYSSQPPLSSLQHTEFN